MNEALLRQLSESQRRIAVLERAEVLPVVARYSTTSQTFTNTTITIVDYGTSVYDTRSAVTTGAGWVFTAPVGGYYRVSAVLTWGATSNWATGESAFLFLYKNGTLNAYLDVYQFPATPSGSFTLALHGTCNVYCAQDDTLNIRAQQISGGSLGLTALATANYVSIELCNA